MLFSLLNFMHRLIVQMLNKAIKNDRLVLLENIIVFWAIFKNGTFPTLLLKGSNKSTITKQLYFQTTIALLHLNIIYEISHALQVVGILFHLAQPLDYQMAFVQSISN